jgi:hypothetical protein
LEAIVAIEKIKDNLGWLLPALHCEEHSRPEVLEGICGGGLDGVRTVDGDFVVTSDVLGFLEVVVSFRLAVLGEGEEIVGLDEGVAKLDGVFVNGYFGVFPEGE